MSPYPPVRPCPDSDPESRSPFKVIVVDDHALFRRGLVSVLDAEVDIDVMGEAGDGEEAIRLAKTTEPDVVLMDVWMPHSRGIEACAQIRQILPDVKIVMLTMSDEGADLIEALKAGANGYLLKEIAVSELARAVRAVGRGLPVMDPLMATRLIGEFARLAKESPDPPAGRGAGLESLSAREVDVLRLITRSFNNRQIGQRLFIAENTVKNHVRSILEKLGVRSRTEAAVYAVRHGLS